MKQVIIEVRNGKAVVVSCPKKIEVIIREPKKRSLRKIYRTYLYHLKTMAARVVG